MTYEQIREVPMGDIAREVLEKAKRKLDSEGINPAATGILGHNLSADIATTLISMKESRGKEISLSLARYLKDDLETGMSDRFDPDVAAVAIRYLADYLQEQKKQN